MKFFFYILQFPQAGMAKEIGSMRLQLLKAECSLEKVFEGPFMSLVHFSF